MLDRCKLPTILLAAVMVCGCNGKDAAGPVVIAASGDTAGWIVPCGCTSNQAGGLPRRASYVDGLKAKGDVLLVDAGSAPGGNCPYERLKFEAIAKGEVAMGIDAHNIGAGEAALGAEYLRTLASETGLPLLSVNVLDGEGELVGVPSSIVSTGGRKLLLVGVMSESFAEADITATSPRAAILDAIEDAEGQYDAAVVLAYMPDDELIDLAEQLPEVDIVLGGPTGQPIKPKRFGPTLLASATNQGKFMVELAADGKDWQGEIVELGEQFEDDKGQQKNLEDFYAALAERDFTPGDTQFVDPLPPGLPKSYAIAGSESCAACHEEEYAAWKKSYHAHAWASLEEKGAHVDPDCQRCHTTGYGMPEGFVSVRTSAARVNVGCENCHGPSKGHVEDSDVRTAHYGEAENHCRHCHDRENSPKFDYDEYWAKICHGKADDEKKTDEEDR